MSENYNYADLAGNVIRTAIEDYECALFSLALHEVIYLRGESNKKLIPKNTIEECEKFFKSKHFDRISIGDVDGEALMRKSQKEIAELVSIVKKIMRLDSARIALVQKALRSELYRRYCKKQRRKG